MNRTIYLIDNSLSVLLKQPKMRSSLAPMAWLTITQSIFYISLAYTLTKLNMIAFLLRKSDLIAKFQNLVGGFMWLQRQT